MICGYEISDAEYRVFYLEGLAHRSVQTLVSDLLKYARLDCRHTVLQLLFKLFYKQYLTRSGLELRIFNTDDQKFSKRQWTGLVPGLLRISLEPGLAVILSRPGTYLMDRTSRECFEALGILNDVGQPFIYFKENG